ncbi:MAG: DUF1223 domain-containing protein [Pseudomonadota bacterium]
MRLLSIVSVIAVSAASLGAASAEDASTEAAAPVVVELFTSQSCSSCVAAATYAADLVRRDDVVVLGWHVDYWNSLRTREGQWVDPYSSAEYTERQRQYNRNLRSSSSVYTPQIVVDGAVEAIGSDRRVVNRQITEEAQRQSSTRLAAERTGDVIEIAVDGQSDAEIFVAYFMPNAQTAVRGGENAGVKFTDVNVVTELRAVGSIDSGGGAFSTPAPEDGYSCAVLVQSPGQGEILAAQYCPAG